MFLPISGCTGCHARGPFFATEVLRRIAAFFSADLRSDVPKGDIWPSSYGAQVMRAGSIAALSGIAGFAVGWITRPLLESRAAALTFQELVLHISGTLHPLLVPAANQTLVHLALYGLSCGVLGFVVARLATR